MMTNKRFLLALLLALVAAFAYGRMPYLCGASMAFAIAVLHGMRSTPLQWPTRAKEEERG